MIKRQTYRGKEGGVKRGVIKREQTYRGKEWRDKDEKYIVEEEAGEEYGANLEVGQPDHAQHVDAARGKG